VRFSEEDERFLRPGTQRLLGLAGLLGARSLPYSVVKTGASRHVVARVGKGLPRLALAAHYDRVSGSPGVLDNSCACIQLADFAQRRARAGGPPLLFLFTDGEEAAGSSGAAEQGSFSLARALRSVGEGEGGSEPLFPPVLVLDVTGRGDRIVLSSSPAALFERNGLGDTRAARAHESLVGLAREAAARAGLAQPSLLPLPWSDDLGLALGGFGALTLSLLPASELALLPAGVKPATWGYLHGPGDGPRLAEPGAFALVAAFLDALAQIVPDKLY
jgi:hypothetical protein